MSRGRFLLNAILIAGLLALFLNWLNMPLVQQPNPSAPLTEQETRYLQKIRPVSPGEVASLIQQKAGKPAVLLLYTSWCGYCKKQFPILRQLEDEKKGKAHFIYLSLDEKPEALARFLVGHRPPEDFISYRYTGRSIGEPLKELNVKYEGGIPFTVVFNSKGTLHRSFLGLTEKSTLSRALEN